MTSRKLPDYSVAQPGTEDQIDAFINGIRNGMRYEQAMVSAGLNIDATVSFLEYGRSLLHKPGRLLKAERYALDTYFEYLQARAAGGRANPRMSNEEYYAPESE